MRSSRRRYHGRGTGTRRSSGKRQYALYVKPKEETIRGQQHLQYNKRTKTWRTIPAEWHGYEKHMQSTDKRAINRERKRVSPRYHTRVYQRNPSIQHSLR